MTALSPSGAHSDCTQDRNRQKECGPERERDPQIYWAGLALWSNTALHTSANSCRTSSDDFSDTKGQQASLPESAIPP